MASQAVHPGFSCLAMDSNYLDMTDCCPLALACLSPPPDWQTGNQSQEGTSKTSHRVRLTLSSNPCFLHLALTFIIKEPLPAGVVAQWFPALIVVGSQPPVTPTPGALMPSSGRHRHPHLCGIHSHRHTHISNKKINHS